MPIVVESQGSLHFVGRIVWILGLVAQQAHPAWIAFAGPRHLDTVFRHVACSVLATRIGLTLLTIVPAVPSLTYTLVWCLAPSKRWDTIWVALWFVTVGSPPALQTVALHWHVTGAVQTARQLFAFRAIPSLVILRTYASVWFDTKSRVPVASFPTYGLVTFDSFPALFANAGERPVRLAVHATGKGQGVLAESAEEAVLAGALVGLVAHSPLPCTLVRALRVPTVVLGILPSG